MREGSLNFGKIATRRRATVACSACCESSEVTLSGQLTPYPHPSSYPSLSADVLSERVVSVQDDPAVTSIAFADRLIDPALDDRECGGPGQMDLARADSQHMAAEPFGTQVTFVIDRVSVFPMPLSAVDLEREASLDE